jgi:hypothetical protein
VQPWGGPIQEIKPGDVVRIPPGQKHWHGASPTTTMTHLAIQEQLDGRVVDWWNPSATSSMEGNTVCTAVAQFLAEVGVAVGF